MPTKNISTGESLCQHCGQERKTHWATNLSDGQMVSGEVLTCPTAIFKEFEPEIHAPSKGTLKLGQHVIVKKWPRRNAIWAGTFIEPPWPDAVPPKPARKRHHVIIETPGPDRYVGHTMNEEDFTPES